MPHDTQLRTNPKFLGKNTYCDWPGEGPGGICPNLATGFRKGNTITGSVVTTMVCDEHQKPGQTIGTGLVTEIPEGFVVWTYTNTNTRSARRTHLFKSITAKESMCGVFHTDQPKERATTTPDDVCSRCLQTIGSDNRARNAQRTTANLLGS